MTGAAQIGLSDNCQTAPTVPTISARAGHEIRLCIDINRGVGIHDPEFRELDQALANKISREIAVCIPATSGLKSRSVMRALDDIISLLTDPGIIAVVRAQRADQVPKLTEALLAGGVIAVEITMTTPNALAAIREAVKQFGRSALIGVGSVLNAATAQAALDAGAEFVVSPITRPELVPVAHAAHKPVMLGAYSPTEAQTVHESGADFVKIFPADGLGPGYLKALRAPMPHLRLVPTGGVDLHNVADFLRAGCAALGVGSSLVSSKILAEGNWTQLTLLAGEFVKAVRDYRRPAGQ
jgi:2-dehydro-3-deoxyphosphogluconate aldolase / (4S)-4-hydroxy-2-oxoglutarate aldolase